MSTEALRLREALIEAKPYLDHKRDCPFRLRRDHCACGYRDFMERTHNLANTNPEVSQRRSRPQLVTDEARLAQSTRVRGNGTTNREAHVRTALLSAAVL